MHENYLEDRARAEAATRLLAQQFVTDLKAASGNQLDVSLIPPAIAHALNLLDPSSFYLESTVEAYAGMRMFRVAAEIEKMDLALRQRAAMSPSTKVEVGAGDRYAYIIPNSPYWRGAVYIETQTQQFIYLMRYGSARNMTREAYLGFEQDRDLQILRGIEAGDDVEAYGAPQVFVCEVKAPKQADTWARQNHWESTQPSWTQQFALFAKEGRARGALHWIGRLQYALDVLLAANENLETE